MPVVGVGLLYKRGYVQQVLNRDNWQVERYPENDWYNMPVQIVNDASGKPLRVEVDLAGERVRTVRHAAISAGLVEVEGDGSDDAGQSVPPGSYLYRIAVDSDGGEEARVGHVAVAY